MSLVSMPEYPGPTRTMPEKWCSSSPLVYTGRGKDRDVFFAELPGWDMNFDIAAPLRNAFKEINDCLLAFREEMKAQKIWDQGLILM